MSQATGERYDFSPQSINRARAEWLADEDMADSPEVASAFEAGAHYGAICVAPPERDWSHVEALAGWVLIGVVVYVIAAWLGVW